MQISILTIFVRFFFFCFFVVQSSGIDDEPKLKLGNGFLYIFFHFVLPNRSIHIFSSVYLKFESDRNWHCNKIKAFSITIIALGLFLRINLVNYFENGSTKAFFKRMLSSKKKTIDSNSHLYWTILLSFIGVLQSKQNNVKLSSVYTIHHCYNQYRI